MTQANEGEQLKKHKNWGQQIINLQWLNSVLVLRFAKMTHVMQKPSFRFRISLFAMLGSSGSCQLSPGEARPSDSWGQQMNAQFKMLS